MNNIATPNCFKSTFVKKKEITSIILALQMAQTTSSLKVQVEIIFDVNHFNLVQHMAIMFPIHSLHLIRMTVKTNKRGEFKQNITIKCGRNARNNLNTKTIIVQISQLGASMRDKGHCLETLNNTQHKWSFHMGNQ
jgi:hypothetical protein